ncbi:hypothetical protein K2173_022091 [Erythroxylum novogranatense]|uniref:Uncharacterized protein n=1 Tax=Erythroxylum novogranatense TaxID=1862640 RepID=A0AAV8TY12_9ROSI|nr:hypothetical protein K2173_022091 [Erythroxylum novogranatense]
MMGNVPNFVVMPYLSKSVCDVVFLHWIIESKNPFPLPLFVPECFKFVSGPEYVVMQNLHSYPFTPDQDSEIMATRVSQRQLIIQSENLDIYGKAVLDGNTKNTKKDIKKSGVALGRRQALGDITNKDPLHHEASLKKKNMIKEEFNEAEEMFLHDHRKCIEEQLKSMNTFSLELVLPGHGSLFTGEYPEAKEAQADIGSPQFYLEPEELPMMEFSDWLKSSTRWISPPSSPTCWDAPPLSPSSWQFETVEYELKGESDY